MEAILMFLAPLVGTLAGKYGVVVTIISWIGVARLLVKPIMNIARVIVGLTPSTKDDEILVKVETSKAYSTVLFVLDWLLSLKLHKEEAKKIDG